MITWLSKWPGHPAMSFLVWLMIIATGAIVLSHMAQGNEMPEGYGEWYLFLGALAGVNVGAMGVRRSTDYKYKELDALNKPDVVTGGPTTVKVDADSKLSTGEA